MDALNKPEQKALEGSPCQEILFWIKKAIYLKFPWVDESVVHNLVLTVPPNHVEAHYSLSTFQLQKSTNQTSVAIAKSIVEYCVMHQIPVVKQVFSTGSYVNIEVYTKFFYREFFSYMRDQGQEYGICQKQKDSKVICINYLDNSFYSILLGQTIRKFNGTSNILHHYFKDQDPELIYMGREVVHDALENSCAEYVANTNVIVSIPRDNLPAVVLQKNDKSLTLYALYLGYLKKILRDYSPSRSIYIVTAEQAEIANFLIVFSKILFLKLTNIDSMALNIGQLKINEKIVGHDLALKYTILRTPYNKINAISSESFSFYYQLIDTIETLENSIQKDEYDNKDIAFAQMILDFSHIVADISSSLRFDKMCIYLEKLASTCETRTIHKYKEQSICAATVLRNGLRLLVD